MKKAIRNWFVFFEKDPEEKLKKVNARYYQALGPDANSLLQDAPEEDIQEQHDDLYESTDDSDWKCSYLVVVGFMFQNYSGTYTM